MIEGVIAQLKANSGVMNLVSNRIYSEVGDDQIDFPVIVLESDLTDNDYDYENIVSPQGHHLNVYIVGKSYKSSLAVSNAVKKAIDNTRGQWGDETIDGCFLETETKEVSMPGDAREYKLYLRTQTYLVWVEV